MPNLHELVRAGVDRGARLVRRPPATAQDLGRSHPDLDAAFATAWERAAPYTMTSVERMFGLWQAVLHVSRHGVPGDVVECGVWRGGSSMLAALALRHAGDERRALWLYDTFAGMTEPGDEDADLEGTRMADIWERHRGRKDSPLVCFGALDDVRSNMHSTGWPPARTRYVEGPVEETIPGDVPDQIAVLRLDTDWYASTRHELAHLWQRLSPNGVLIVDDYGHWAGARRAVDEFFDGRPDAPLLSRLDYTGRMGVKPAA
jgi:hypothetical protein